MYKNYKSQVSNPVKEKLYKDVLESSGVVISSLLLEHGNFKLPLGLKNIEVTKTKDFKRKAVDSFQSRSLKTKILNFKTHSDGCVYGIKYKPKGCLINGIFYFHFKGHRLLTRAFSVIFQTQSKSYV